MALLRELLSSRARAEIFRLLFGLSSSELHLRAVERRSGLTVATIRQEFGKLERLGLVLSRRDGNRLYFRANQTHPLCQVVRELVLKTAGLVDVLKEALDGLDIDLAWVFGSVARFQEDAVSDVDLMVIGTVSLRKLSEALREVHEKIGREVNPYVLTVQELRQRVQRTDHFISQLLDSEFMFVIGCRDELEAMAGLRLADRPHNQPG